MQVLDKAPGDNRQFAIFCAPLLLNGALIASVGSTPTQAPLSAGLQFQVPTINTVPLTAEIEGNVVTAPIGTAIQVWISGGIIPSIQPYLPIAISIPFMNTAGETLVAMATLRLIGVSGT